MGEFKTHQVVDLVHRQVKTCFCSSGEDHELGKEIYQTVDEIPGPTVMTPEQFLLDRIQELRDQMLSLGFEWKQIDYMLDSQEEMIKFHKNWPILVTEEPSISYDQPVMAWMETFQIQVHQKIEWLTNQEYIKRFGKQPPTAPMIRVMLVAYSGQGHPDFNEDWLL